MSVSDEIHNCCPFCGGEGFTVFSNNGEPEQEQCQFCYDVAYPLAEKVAKFEEYRDALQLIVDDPSGPEPLCLKPSVSEILGIARKALDKGKVS